MEEQLGFLDILSIISFIIMLQNQSKLVGIQDVQRAVDEIHKHLEIQDDKIDALLEVLHDNH